MLPPRGIAVLGADNDPDNLEILEYVITAQGATVRRAQDAREALELPRGWKPDVLLLDIEMPKMDGYELLSLIRLDPALRNVPAVAVTGLAHPTDKAETSSSGGRCVFAIDLPFAP